MTQLEAYERALSLFGKIFGQLKCREARYFFASIKSSFVFFLYGLILNDTQEFRSSTATKEHSRKVPLFPRTSSDWFFDSNFIRVNENNPGLWDADKLYFKNEQIKQRSGDGVAVLSYGFDLHRAFTLDEVEEREKIHAIIDWPGTLRQRPYTIIKNWRILFGTLWPAYFLKHVAMLNEIFRLLRAHSNTNIRLFYFFRYFSNYAFCTARVRGGMRLIGRDFSIGKILFSV